VRYPTSRITIIIPAKNESKGLRSIIRSVKPYAAEVIVVDGHSTDHTAAIAKSEHVRYFLDYGKGRGDGVRVGLSAAKHPIVVLFDADGSHEATDILKLIAPILSGKADLVIASRRTGGSFDRRMDPDSLVRSLGADLLAMMVNHTFHTNLTDILYSFRAIRTSAVPKLHLEANGFAIEQEMVVSALRHHLKVIELPSREHARAWGESKLRTLTGITLLIQLIRQLYL
jgi:glycosyltransferase involved in cell wall biosynthesis